MARAALAINSLTGAGFCEPLENGSSRNLQLTPHNFVCLRSIWNLGILHSWERRKTGVVAQKRSNSDEYCILPLANPCFLEPTTLGAAVEVLDCCITSVVSLLTGVITAVFSLFHRPAAPKYYNCPSTILQQAWCPQQPHVQDFLKQLLHLHFFQWLVRLLGGEDLSQFFLMIWDWLANEISWTI